EPVRRTRSSPPHRHRQPLRQPMKKACFAVALLLWAAPVAAQNSAQKEAGSHFQRGVVLYNEADYRGALVEFKRAYEVSPAVAVLYNIGQTSFQLQDYANALHMFERYLAEGGGPHKAEVEGSVATLRTRVGKIDVTTTAQGCDIAIDDEPVGKSPLPKPVLM